MRASLKHTLLARLDSLIAEGEILSRGTRQRKVERQDEDGFPYMIEVPVFAEPDKFTKWRTSAMSVLDLVVPSKSVHRPAFLLIRDIEPPELAKKLPFLKGIRDDFAFGLFDSLESRLEVAYSADILGMSEDVLAEDVKKDSAHIVAAVLCGASLERTLRGLCERHHPPVATTKTLKDGSEEHLAMNALIDALAKADAFNAARAHQLRAWAHIRNHAAHGRWDQFKRGDVETMLVGVRDFIGGVSNG